MKPDLLLDIAPLFLRAAGKPLSQQKMELSLLLAMRCTLEKIV